MSTHISILPLDIFDILTARLNHQGNRHLDSAARFLRLPHPRTGFTSLFLLQNSHPQDDNTKTGFILEVQAVSPTNARSWFVGEEVVADGKLLVMTPMDPMFLLAYILRVPRLDGLKGNFRPMPDIIEEVSATITAASEKDVQKDPSLKVSTDDIISFLSLDFVQSSLKRVCDVKVVTEEITVYRYSHDIVMENLKRKVERLSKSRIAEMSRTLVRNLAKDGLMDDGQEEMLELGRIKLACELLSQYLPQDMLRDLIASYDFSKLNVHLKTVKDEELALVDVATDTRNRAKAANAVAATNVNKKRKKDTLASHGVEKLKKANVAGMSKLSTFFMKKAA